MSPTERFAPPRRQDLTLALEMREPERRLLRHPCMSVGGLSLPIIHFAGEVLCCEDCRRGHHHKFDLGNGHARPLRLFGGILQHDDVLGDAIRLHIVLVHVGAEGDHVDGVEPSAVGVEEGNDVEGHTFV